MDLSTRLWGISTEFVVFIPQNLVLRSIVRVSLNFNISRSVYFSVNVFSNENDLDKQANWNHILLWREILTGQFSDEIG